MGVRQAVIAVAAVGGILACALPLTAGAAWAPNGNPLCTASGDQLAPKIVSDGAEGAIVVWLDKRVDGNGDLYAQRLDATGSPLWPTDGAPVSVGINWTDDFSVVSDGDGGAIVVWGDQRESGAASHFAIFAQRLTPTGQIAPGWPVDGLQVAPQVPWQVKPVAVSDGKGGVLMAWRDVRDGPPWDIYAQRITASGGVALGWPAAGRPVTRIDANTDQLAIATDGAHGALIAWRDERHPSDDIYCMRLTSDGQVATGWIAEGSPACTANGDQMYPTLVPDGAGGAFIAWRDYRSTNTEIFVQHLGPAGAPEAGWTLTGMVAGMAPLSQVIAAILPDGDGGVYLVWGDGREGAFTVDVYCGRIGPDGLPRPGWPASGLPVCIGARVQAEIVATNDGVGGLIIAWRDQRSPNDIYAQRVDGSGSIAAGWPFDGVAQCLATGTQELPAIAATGGGAATVAWQDGRSAVGKDIYVQRIGPAGPFVSSVEGERRGGVATAVPNPSSGDVCITFDLPDALPVALVVHDLMGRHVRTIGSTVRRAGSHAATWDGRGDDGALVSAGIYFVRVAGSGPAHRIPVVRLRP